MAKIEVKSGSVNIWGLEEPMRPVLKYAGEIWEDHGEILVVTSARDGIHSAGSLHYYGLAVDFRTHYFPDNIKKQVAKQLIDTLKAIDPAYQVIIHSKHIHVEYDKGF